MKKIFICIVLFLLFVFSSFSQSERKIALGMGPEWNMNSRENFAGGMAVCFDYMLPYSFTAGSSLSTGALFTASYNFNNFTVLEPALLLRLYFNGGGVGLFAQAETGVFIFLEDGDVSPMFLGWLRGGYRVGFGTYYVEPYVRIGYPFAFGIGAIAGVRL